ncbi:MAG TPA: copper resistance protein CopC [Crenalkalicoccus sp.]|nr:copper resistance protein CopC [Crenalkalicoccus sp.]
MRAIAMAVAALGLLLAPALAGGAGRAAAETPRVVASQPPPGGVVGRGPNDVFVRFAGPVDHYRSSLVIARGGQPVEVLHPTLNAAPEVLFAIAPMLEPGDYELRWMVRSFTDGEVTEGSLPFTVRDGAEGGGARRPGG